MLAPPPTRKITTESMRKFKEWTGEVLAAKASGRRSISDRTMKFINWIRKKIEVANTTKDKKIGEELEEDLEVASAKLSSDFDRLHKADNVVDALFDLHDSLEEARAAFEYGDYLSLVTADLRGNKHVVNPHPLPWFVPSQDWDAVSQEILIEEKALADGKRDPTPYIDAVRQQAAKRTIPFEVARFQILRYAQRGQMVHSGIANLIHRCEWHELALRILRDKDNLNRRCPGDPAKMHLMATINQVQSEHYIYCKWKPGDEGNIPDYAVTVKAADRAYAYALNRAIELAERPA